jgi:predicted amidophosphoribosyltransferase
MASLASVLSALLAKTARDNAPPCELCGNPIHETSSLCRRCELRLRGDERVGRRVRKKLREVAANRRSA